MQSTLPQELVREIPHDHWMRENEDEKKTFESSVGSWLEGVAKNERLFQSYVYDNPDLTDFDLRQHRARIHSLLADGELLALKLLALGQKTSNPREVQALLDPVEQKRKELFGILFGWHGPLESQPDVPATFKEAAREAAAGNVVDLDV